LDDDYLGAVSSWPETLSNLVQEVEQPIPKPKSDYKLALSALGAIFWYLRKCLIDVDLITMRKFECYIPATMFNIQVSLR
jgi:DNA mismatch repair protein MSH6